MPRKVAGKPGWVEGSADELLDLSAEESALVQLRLDLADAVRARRVRLGITQAELARRTGSTQPRVTRLEQGDASFDALAWALLALGAGRRGIAAVIARSSRSRVSRSTAQTRRPASAKRR